MAFVTGQRFLKVHVFPYSRREGTPAYDYPEQVPEHEKEDRSRRMTAAVEAVRAEEAARMQGARQMFCWKHRFLQHCLPVTPSNTFRCWSLRPAAKPAIS